MDLPTVKSDATLFSEFVEGKGGKFYATSREGGKSYEPFVTGGKIYEINPNNSNVNKRLITLHNFDFVNGFYPIGGLIKGKDGKLYGTACGTATFTNNQINYDYSTGVIYSFDLNKKNQHIKFYTGLKPKMAAAPKA